MINCWKQGVTIGINADFRDDQRSSHRQRLAIQLGTANDEGHAVAYGSKRFRKSAR